jgi:hypothetical protein
VCWDLGLAGLKRMPNTSELKVLPPGSWKTPKFKLPSWVHEYNCVKV